MSPQIQRGIVLIVLPLPSERAGERLLFPIPSSQTHRGIPLIVPPLLSERVGERLLFTPFSLRRGLGRGFFRVCFRLLLLWTIREESVHIAPHSPPINEKRGRASLRDLHRNLVSNYYKIVISKVGFLSIQATSLSRHSLCLQ